MKILVTGAGGQLGRALQSEIAKRPAHSAIPFSHQELDITDFALVRETIDGIQPDAVVNAAAYNFVDKAESETALAFAANETGPGNLAKTTATLDIPFVHVSTDYVFDGALRRPYVESDLAHPLSIYAKSKEAGEKSTLSKNPKSYVIRTAWVYHVGGKSFMGIMLSLKDKPEIKVVNDQYGSPTYAPHLAAKILDMLESKSPVGIYHIAGRGSATRYDLAKSLFSKLGLATSLKPVAAKDFPAVAVRPAYSVLDTEKGEAFRLPPWEQGVSEFVKELKNGMRTAEI